MKFEDGILQCAGYRALASEGPIARSQNLRRLVFAQDETADHDVIARADVSAG